MTDRSLSLISSSLLAGGVMDSATYVIFTEIFTRPLVTDIKRWISKDIPGILTKNKVSLTLAERALAPDSPANHGICCIINGLAIDSTAAPYLRDEPGAVITIPGELYKLGDGKS